MGSSSPSSNGYFHKYILSGAGLFCQFTLTLRLFRPKRNGDKVGTVFVKEVFKLQLPCLNIQHMTYDIKQIFGVAVISLWLEYLENSFLGLIGISCMTLALVTREVVQSFDQSSSSFLKLANFLKVQVSNWEFPPPAGRAAGWSLNFSLTREETHKTITNLPKTDIDIILLLETTLQILWGNT